MERMPIFTEPFVRISIDIVGPLNPCSSAGHRYILTLVDCATGFTEAIPKREITTIAVSEALVEIFSRLGIPREIQSDNGPQFTSKLMGELHNLLGVKPIFSSVYRPQTQGRVECFQSTLKASLRKLCSEKPKEWRRYLIPTLFALREMPSDRTEFSAFELLFSRQVRGPLAVLKDLWEYKQIKSDERETFQYALDLQNRLEDCAKIAAQNADISSKKYKDYFDVKSQGRSFTPSEEVLVLLPDTQKKLTFVEVHLRL